ncbi:MAG: hypothetical protein QM677_01030 [Microbacterium sp.]
MVHSFDVRALGVRVRVGFDAEASSSLVERARRVWIDALACEAGDPAAQVCVSPLQDEEHLLERLSMSVTLAALDARRGTSLMFHAAGVAAADGRVIAFVGPSGRGKTTLTRVLAREWGYVSDETISIGDDLRVFPYRKPLSIVRPGAPKEQVPASSLGLRELPSAPLRLAGLVLLDRVDGLATPNLTRVPLVEAIDDLVAQMSYLPELHRPLQRLAALAADVGGVLRLSYSEASTLPPLIESVLDGDVAPLPTRFVPAVPSPISSTSVVAPSVVDAIDVGDAVIVLSGRTVRVLGGIAPEIWHFLVEGGPREQIVAAVVDCYGPPVEGDAEGLVDAAIDDLVASELIRCRFDGRLSWL